MALPLIVIILAALLPDLYIWGSFIRNLSVVYNIIWWLPTAAMVISPLLIYTDAGRNFVFRYILILVLIFVLPKLIFVLISLLGRLVALAASGAGIYFNAAGAAAAGIAVICAIYGMAAGWTRFTVKNTEICSPDIPEAFDGYRIVQLSDFHISTFSGRPEAVKRVVELVNAQKADAICFTGDLVNINPDEADAFAEQLAVFKSADGVFSVLGNHDYCPYMVSNDSLSRRNALEKVIETERRLSWKLLLNEHVMLHRGADSIAVAGVENGGTPPFENRADLAKATDGIPNETYTILLSHDPSYWKRNILKDSKVQLTLSGHTHAMQLRIGRFCPAALVYPEWGGLYEQQGRQLFVSAGVGCNVAFRFGAWPEINVLTLRRK